MSYLAGSCFKNLALYGSLATFRQILSSGGHCVLLSPPFWTGMNYLTLTPRNFGLRKMLGLAREVSVAVTGQAGSRACTCLSMAASFLVGIYRFHVCLSLYRETRLLGSVWVCVHAVEERKIKWLNPWRTPNHLHTIDALILRCFIYVPTRVIIETSDQDYNPLPSTNLPPSAHQTAVLQPEGTIW